MAQATTPADWTTESDYWRKSYRTRPYVEADRDYDYYEPAYRYGFESETQYRGRSWDDVQADLERGWDSTSFVENWHGWKSRMPCAIRGIARQRT